MRTCGEPGKGAVRCKRRVPPRGRGDRLRREQRGSAAAQGLCMATVLAAGGDVGKRAVCT